MTYDNEFDKEMARAEAVLDHAVLMHNAELRNKLMNEHLDKMVKNPDEDVRVFAAKVGRPQDWDILVNDPSPFVRMAVAHYGRPEDRQKLLSDPSPRVRGEARRRLK